MDREEDLSVPRPVIVKRLRKIEGQIRGLQKMVIEERECESIITQLAAVRAAIDSAGALVLNNYMGLCFLNSKEEVDESDLRSLARVVAIWGRVKVGDIK